MRTGCPRLPNPSITGLVPAESQAIECGPLVDSWLTANVRARDQRTLGIFLRGCNEMKQCPLCRRTYSDDLRYCLDDGAVLVAYQDDEVTRVSPQPVPAPPVPPAPPRRQGWTALGVIGLILVVLLWGGLKLALWSADREDHTSGQNTNSAAPSFGVRSSPSPSPTPTPTVTPHPSPSPSPSATAVEPTEKTLNAGTYQCEITQPLNEGGFETTRTLKLQFTFNSDGTYTAQGYSTIQATGMNDQLYLETKGSYSQSNGVLMLRDQLERKLDLETNSWKPWGVPSSGSKSSSRIQNIRPTTFQLDIGPQGAWVTFSRL